ncbi:hypothetical protein INR49_027776 [Caranx melampygus]|nr:hypothetical protein INR49_027776 [Caranx melampygus]
MPQAVSLLPFLLALMGYAIAGLSIWPSLHVALSNASVFVDYSTKSNISTIRNISLSLVNMETNTTLLTRTLPNNQPSGKVEFNCSSFLYAGTFRFLLRETTTAVSYANGTDVKSTETTTSWWSSELQVQWPTFHIAVGISTSEYFQACSSTLDSALFLEVSYIEYNQIGRNSIDKVRVRTRHPIKLLRSQTIELSCVFPFTERDFIQVALRSPHVSQEVKSSGPLYLSRIFSYKLLVENANIYKSGCDGTMTVKLITPPCAHINGKVLLYKDAGAGGMGAVAAGIGAGGTALMGFRRNKYCFRFVFNFSRSPSPAQTCLLVHRSAESWGPWQPWSVCSVSCGEGVRERVRECLLPSSVGGMQCTGMVKEQSLCSLEVCAGHGASALSIYPPAPVGVTLFGGNMIVDPERLSPSGQKMLPPIFGYRLAQQQLKEMKKKGLKEATQLYHISSSPVHDTLVETSASATTSPIPTPTGFSHSALSLSRQDSTNHNHFHIATTFSEPPSQTSRATPDRLSPRVELILGPPVSGGGGSSKWRDRTADWVEMVERSGLAGLRGGDAPMGNSIHKNPNFRRTSSFNDTKPQLPSSAQCRQFRERSMTQVGSRTLPEGSCWTKGGWERRPYHAYPIPEHEASDWAKSRPQRNDQRKPWTETAVPSHNSELRHTGTNTNSISALDKQAKADINSTGERQRSSDPRGACREGISGIGGPTSSHGVNQLSIDRAERAEQNWNRRGPSPIQRNILARKLKEAQSSSGARGRQRSSTFSVSSSDQRKGRCRSLPMSGDYSSSSPYRLSEAEQRMLDLDLSSSYAGEE